MGQRTEKPTPKMTLYRNPTVLVNYWKVRTLLPTRVRCVCSGHACLGEGFLLVRLDDVGIALWAAAVTFVSSALTGFADALSALATDWMFLIGILIAAAIALL